MTVLSTCTAALPLASGGWQECGQPTVSTYAYACQHKHVVIKSTCAEHKPVPGTVGCRQCWDAGHECAMAITGPVPTIPERWS